MKSSRLHCVVLSNTWLSMGSCGSRISRKGGANSRGGYVSKILYVKTKESGPLGGARAGGAPWIRHWWVKVIKSIFQFMFKQSRVTLVHWRQNLLPQVNKSPTWRFGAKTYMYSHRMVTCLEESMGSLVAQLVEHSKLNQQVPGSFPGWGIWFFSPDKDCQRHLFFNVIKFVEWTIMIKLYNLISENSSPTKQRKTPKVGLSPVSV